ncbi:MAG: leucine-rich repeat domain-containing protein, partial [Clostridiales bacterium]|nr:leucine-rich repeat domain-containing protein [Clostridiales bacterium]
MKKCVKSLAMTIVSIIICAVFLTACGMPTISPVVNGGSTNGATTTAPEYNDEITSGGISVGETDKFEYTYKTDNYEADVKPNAPQIDLPNNTEIKSNEQLPDEQPILTGEVSDKLNTGEVADPVGSTEMETPNEKTSDDETVSAIYIASAGGRIIGESEQVLIKNQFTSAVVAEADVGYRFTRWSDGIKDKKRNDKVSRSFIVTAEFQPIDSGIVENDLLFNLLNDGTGYAVEAYNRRLTVAIIPSIVNGLPVKEIASRGFDYCMDLKRVSLPETVKVIRENAFEECTNLKIVKGMSGVEEICARAFSGCSQLERIIGICNVKKIRAYAFSKCLELENLILSDTIEYLESGDKAMESLKPVFLRKTKEEFKAVYIEKFPNGDKFRPKAIYIGAEGKPNAEYANKEDDELFSFTPTIDGMGYVVSAKDAKMTEALIPSHYNGMPVTEIAERGFADCNVVTAYIPDSVKKVGNNAFAECRNLIRVAGLTG